MSKNDYILSELKRILSSNDIENDNGIISFYDLICFAVKELSILENVTDENSLLAQEINNYSLFNKYIGNYKTKVRTRVTDDNNIESAIKISSNFNNLIFSKYKDSKNIKVSPTCKGKEKFIRRCFDSVIDTFHELEKYSELIGNIDDNVYCFMYDLNPMLYLRIYYSSNGYIFPMINVKNSVAENEHYENEEIKKFIFENTPLLLKKFSFDINSDLSIYDNNKILLLAQKRYNDEKKLMKVKKYL